MSYFVDGSGHTMTYVVANVTTKDIIGGFNTVQSAHRAVVAQEANSSDEFALHNITHQKCPDWIKDLFMADKAYCGARAADLKASADRRRREATTILAEADRIQAMAEVWYNRRIALP